MAKSKSDGSDGVADQIAEFIGKTMGDLVNRKESLQRELSEVEGQIAGVRDAVVRQLGPTVRAGRKAGKRAIKRGRKAVKTARRALSPETRAKMAAAAKKRWAAAKKAGKTALG